MNQSAGPASIQATPGSLAAEKIIQEGEIIILTVKPSGWFVLLVSWPVLVVAALVAAAAYIAGETFYADVPRQTAYLVCSVLGGLRVILACFQWLARLYVLTNRRIVTFRGLMCGVTTELSLESLVQAAISATALERMLGLGSLYFQNREERTAAVGWIHLARAVDVQEIVNETIRRAK